MAKASRSHSISSTRVVIRSFTSQWFLIPQGTGILAVILHNLDYQFRGLGIISGIFWVLTIVLLILFLFLCVLRISGLPAGLVAYVLWWINTAIAIVTCIRIPYVFVKYEPPGVNALSPTTRLPLISALTPAAGGAIICTYGELNNRLQVPVIIVSYLLVGMALPLSLGFDSLFLTRLFDRSSLKGMKVYQDMILCGPWGQGSFALQALGEVVLNGSFAGYSRGMFLTAQAAMSVGYASILAGLVAWGQGTFWWAFAIISIAQMAFMQPSRLKGLEFGLPAWAIVFPWGVYTNAAVELGKLLDSPAFNAWSTALAVMLVIIWLVNVVLTIKSVTKGKILGLNRGWRGRYYDNDEVADSE